MDGSAASDREGGIRARLPRPDAAVALRAATEDDLDAIAALFAPALEQYRGRGGEWLLDAYLAELLDVGGRFETAETYVAITAGRVVGSVAFYADVALEGWSTLPQGWSGFRALVVHPDARGAGVGRLLVEHCARRTREVGAPVLGIHTVSLLEDAVRLYGRLGFVRCPEYDLRAADVFPVNGADDMVALAFRYDLG
jgi:GNAT superfamily N-acetyltransferase